MFKVGNKVALAADRMYRGEIASTIASNVGKPTVLFVTWENSQHTTACEEKELVLRCPNCGSGGVRECTLENKGTADICWSCGTSFNVEIKKDKEVK